MLVFLVCLVLLVLTIYLYLESNRLKNIPSPPGHFLLGHSAKLNSSEKVLPQLLEYYREYGGCVAIKLGPIQGIVLSDYVMIQKVLNTQLNKAQGNFFMEDILRNGLLMASGQHWSKMRKIIGTAFYVPVLKQFIKVFNSNSTILLQKLEESKETYFNFLPFTTSFTLDMICEATMGIKANAQLDPSSKYIYHIHKVAYMIVKRFFSLLGQNQYTYLLTKDYWAQKESVKYLHNFSQNILDKRRGEKDNLDPKSLLNILLASQVDGRALTDEEIIDEISTFMVAGHDTVSSSLLLIFYNIARYPDIQEKIVNELDFVFSGDQDRAVTNEDLIELKYTEMVIKESMRLYPAAPLVTRTLTDDVQLGSTILPKGTFVVVNFYNAHRDPEVFPDPDTFNPEHFSAENQSEKVSQCFMPFGAGPRHCIGHKYAMMAMKTTVANVLRKFKVLPKEGNELVLHFAMLLKAEVILKFTPREF